MKKLFGNSLVLLASLFLAAARVLAEEEPKQDPGFKDEPAAVSVSDVEGLSNKIADLAKNARVGLLLQAQYINSGFNGTQPKGFNSPIKPLATSGILYNDQFIAKRAELSFNGDLNDRKIFYQFKYDPIGTTTAKPGVSTTEQVKDYYVRLSYIPFADLQFGQYKFAQALEGRTPTGEVDFENLALITTALESRRDVAFQVSGLKIPVGPVNLEYAAAIVQGAGQNSGGDNNENKDYAARVGFAIPDPDWNVYLGASGYTGQEPNVGPAVITGATFNRNNTGLEGRITAGGLKLQGEYIQGQLEPGNNYNPWDGLTVAKTIISNPQGWYAFASYRYQDLRFSLRAESYNPDTTAGSKFNINNDVLTAGLDWFQAKDKFRLTVNFEEHFLQYEALLTQAQIYI